MSAAPRPYSTPSRIVGTKGSECHCSSGPVGTTSVWPANTNVGRAVPRRSHRFVVSPRATVSARKPDGASRAAISAWQPASSGVTEARAISARVSSRVGFIRFAAHRRAGRGRAGL
jgi:hypothetical protein